MMNLVHRTTGEKATAMAPQKRKGQHTGKWTVETRSGCKTMTEDAIRAEYQEGSK